MWLACKSYRDDGLTNKETAEKLNKQFNVELSGTAVKRKCTHMRYNSFIPPEVVQTINSDGSQTSSAIIKMSESQAKDPEYVLVAHGYDPDKWTLVSAKSNFWQQKSNVTLYQSKITVKPATDTITPKKVAELLKNVEPQYYVAAQSHGDSNLVIPLADLHFGITTRDDLRPLLDRLHSIMSAKCYKKIVILQLGDLLHSDQFANAQTVKGTQLPTVDMVQAVKDAQWFYKQIIYWANDNTSVYHVGGNHDFDLSYMFMQYLKARYPTVEVHANINYRTAFLLDKVGILIAHGDLAKRKLPMLFATEYPEIWSAAESRVIFTGHFHKEVVNDESGVVTYQLGTPKKPDDYEQKNGYTMAGHKLQIFEFSASQLLAINYVGGK